jgi:DNA-binding CsgD family transcriptional regulator
MCPSVVRRGWGVGAVARLQRRAEEWLDVVADLLAAPRQTWPEAAVATQLRATFELHSCYYSDVGPDGPRALTVIPRDETFGGHRHEIERWAAERQQTEHPLLCFYRATLARVPMQVAEVPDRYAGPAVQAAWVEISRLSDVPHQLSLPLRLGEQEHRAFVLARDAPFTGEEVALATRIWRLLTGLDRQFGALEAARRCGPGPADDVDEAPAPRFTPREQAVLELLGRGHTAAAIGRRLLITESTVHKHLEHIYGKFGVGDRLTAVLAAQRAGFLPAMVPRARNGAGGTRDAPLP